LAVTAVTDAERLLVNAKRALRQARAKAQDLKASGGLDPAAWAAPWTVSSDRG
jgi:hypothetical protein